MTYAYAFTLTQGTTEIVSTTGVGPGKVQVSLVDGSNAALGSQEIDGLSGNFTGLPTNTFTVTAQQLDTNGNPIGDAVTQLYTNGTAGSGPAPVQFLPLSTISGTVSQE